MENARPRLGGAGRLKNRSRAWLVADAGGKGLHCEIDAAGGVVFK